MTDFEFMTYEAAATRLGIAVASVKRQAARRKWPKRKGNDGRVTIGIPVTRLSDDMSPVTVIPSVHTQLAQLETEMAIMRIQFDASERARAMAEQRAETAEIDRDRWHALAIRPWWKRLLG